MPPQEETRKMKMFFSSIKMFLRASGNAKCLLMFLVEIWLEFEKQNVSRAISLKKTFSAQIFRPIELLRYARLPAHLVTTRLSIFWEIAFAVNFKGCRAGEGAYLTLIARGGVGKAAATFASVRGQFASSELLNLEPHSITNVVDVMAYRRICLIELLKVHLLQSLSPWLG